MVVILRSHGWAKHFTLSVFADCTSSKSLGSWRAESTTKGRRHDGVTHIKVSLEKWVDGTEEQFDSVGSEPPHSWNVLHLYFSLKSDALRHHCTEIEWEDINLKCFLSLMFSDRVSNFNQYFWYVLLLGLELPKVKKKKLEKKKDTTSGVGKTNFWEEKGRRSNFNDSYTHRARSSCNLKCRMTCPDVADLTRSSWSTLGSKDGIDWKEVHEECLDWLFADIRGDHLVVWWCCADVRLQHGRSSFQWENSVDKDAAQRCRESFMFFGFIVDLVREMKVRDGWT